MKEYERYIVWLDYFDSSLRRREGRRVPLSAATKAPKIDELAEACERAGFKPVTQSAKHPRSPGKESGYVSIPKSVPKRETLLRLAKELAQVRGLATKRAASGGSGRKK